MAVAGVKADLCLNWPALGTVREGWAAHASQLSVSGFSFMLVGHLEGNHTTVRSTYSLRHRPFPTANTNPEHGRGFLKFKNEEGRKEHRTWVWVWI